jgi:hypothetical protein
MLMVKSVLIDSPLLCSFPLTGAAERVHNKSCDYGAFIGLFRQTQRELLQGIRSFPGQSRGIHFINLLFRMAVDGITNDRPARVISARFRSELIAVC